MSTLYRNYRPNNFSEVLGQNHVKLTLQNEIASGHPGHSYLFCGPRAVGKTTLARILSKAINCENRKEGEFEPCDKCDSCKSIKAGKNLDISEIDAASNTGVDNVRESIISFSRLQPKGKYKVFIIDEVHMLSVPAFNALLKIMEEPPAYVVFVLCTTEVHKIPSTIISRCERFDFQKISATEIVKKLRKISSEEGVDISDDILKSVARQSGGYLRDAESLLGQIFSLGGKKISNEQAELIIPKNNNREAVNIISLVSKKDAAKAVELLNKIIDNGVNVKNFNNELINLSRKILLDKINPGLSDSLGLNLEEEMEKEILEIIKLLSINDISNILDKFLNASYDNRSYLIPQLPLEIAIIEYCHEDKALKNNSNPSNKVSNTNSSLNNNTSNLKAGNINSNNFNKDVNNNDLDSNLGNSLAKEDNSNLKQDISSNNSLNNNESSSNNNNKKGVSLSYNDVCQKWPEFLVKIKN
ncbi:MAG: DNA polymerase III subunit gamma/tau, partial [Patescibacteria group bacterium]|nr:DNA polymerase III subunit gamma/tau [Patescibacteria group bacterium]